MACEIMNNDLEISLVVFIPKSLQIMLLLIQIQLKSCSEFCYNVLLPDIFEKYYKTLTVVVHEYILWTCQSLVNLQ